MPTEGQLASRAAVKPLWFAGVLVRRPRLIILLGILIPIACGAVLQFQGALGLNEPTENDYLIPSEERVIRALAQIAAATDSSINANADIPARALASSSKTMFVVVRAKQGNALTPRIISGLRQSEIALRQLDNYEDHCYLDPAQQDTCNQTNTTLACSPPMSITSAFYGSCYEATNFDPLPQTEFDEIVNTLIFTDGNVNSEFAGFLSTNASFGQSAFLRSIFNFGSPVEGFEDVTDREEEQRQLFVDFSLTFGDESELQSNDDFEMSSFGLDYANAIFANIALMDFIWAFASVAFVFVYLCIHTRSFYLGSLGIVQIILAFPLTWFIYRNILQVRYFAQLHILSVFLILGIGADDIFVLTDAWKQAGVALGSDCPLDTRMSWAYRRAAKAMLVTSFTTSMAFFVTAVSPIMPISTFGLWAACLIIVQFVLCITLYPANVIIWHRFWRYHNLWRLCRLARAPEPCALYFASDPAPLDASGGPEPGLTNFKETVGSDTAAELEREASTASEAKMENKEPPPDSEYRMTERFFRSTWSPFLYRVRYIVLPIAAVLFGMAVWRASLLQPLSEEEVWIPDSVSFRRTSVWLAEEFPVAADTNQLIVDIIHGVDGLDRSEADPYDPLDIGTAVFDETFSLKSSASQQYLLELCERITSSAVLETADTRMPVRCFIRDFLEFNNGTFQEYESEESVGEAFMSFVSFVDPETSARPYRTYLDQGDLGLSSSNQLLYTTITASTPNSNNLPYSGMNPIATAWEDEMEKWNAEAPSGVNNGFATAGYPWSWTVTQNVLVGSSIGGIAFALGVAFVALVVSTLNIVTAVMATVSIIGIVACTLATMQLQGWELGITESVASVIVVGFSVDYVVHIGNSYVESDQEKRYDRTRDALTDMGVSVIAGSISTIGSGVFLWGAVIIFFHKFATILVTTIAFSLFWSLVVFAAALMTFGPTKNFGSLRPLLNKISSLLRTMWSRAKNGETEGEVSSA